MPPGPPPEVTYRCEVRFRTGKVPGQPVVLRGCRQPADGLFRSACACGLHVSERLACRQCAAAADGTCGRCWTQGHACEVTITGTIGVFEKAADPS
jgi:hypothetical protein